MSAHASKGIRFVPKTPPLLGHAPSRGNVGLFQAGGVRLRGLGFLQADDVGLRFAELVKQVRQAAVDVVDVETGDLHRPLHTGSRRPYRQNRCALLQETGTESRLIMTSGRRRMGHRLQFWA